ncbi:MAG TPA: class I SAM-dependent methyltransferase [Dehalococcoidia bacterium]|nr:class I SAM-dependent methyltransferase [Dehalococcoidia bacterium]
MTYENLRRTFNAIHDTYDNVKTMKGPAERLPYYANLTPGQSVLDVGCGTGWCTIAAANLLGNQGKIVGVDIADNLLVLARNKTVTAGISNVEYYLGNAEDLDFTDNSFDVVLSSLVIFFLSDINKALSEWYRVLKPGGTVAISSFGETLYQPNMQMLMDKFAQYEGSPYIANRPRLAPNSTENCRALLNNNGFENIVVSEEQMGFFLPDADAYWQELTSTPWRLRISSLESDIQKKFREVHILEVDSLRTDKGIWIDVPIIFSVASKKLN